MVHPLAPSLQGSHPLTEVGRPIDLCLEKSPSGKSGLPHALHLEDSQPTGEVGRPVISHPRCLAVLEAGAFSVAAIASLKSAGGG